MKAIILFYDSLNRHYLPSYGNKKTIAPNFERLADHTVKFEQSYVGSMPCMPARRELHTGRYNFLHREWGPLEPFDDSMPELLSKAGIYTHLISDHFHYWEDGGATYHNRYSSWEIIRGQEGDHWKGNVANPEIPAVLKIPSTHSGEGPTSLWRYDWVNRQYMGVEEKQSQSRTFELGCDFIKKNASEDNWLLHLETFDPHEPFFAPDKYLKPYEDDYVGPHYDWPRGPITKEDSCDTITHMRKKYSALLSMCDTNLGKVLDLMDSENMWDDTMLIVGTDHGFSLGEHGYWAKNLMPYYNEVAHTPLFIWDPRTKIKGESRTSLVQMIDWAPTLLDFFEQTIPEDMQGKALKKVIQKDEPIRENALFGVFGGHVNITDGQHVYMKSPVLEQRNNIFNYTLIANYMNKRFGVNELQKTTLSSPFKFTKGCPLMKVPAKEKYGVYNFGDLLFNVTEDPRQLTPLTDQLITEQYQKKMVCMMQANDAPQEQYTRIGLANIV